MPAPIVPAPIAHANSLTDADFDAFRRAGVLIVRQVFAGDELARLRELGRKIQAYTKENLPSGTRFWGGSGSKRDGLPADKLADATWGVNEITRPELFEPEVINVMGHPIIDRIQNGILDEPRAWGLKMLWSPKFKGYNLGWHRDQMKSDLYDYVHHKPAACDHVQFNAALNDDHGFHAIPGSHRRPLTEDEWWALNNDKTAELPGEVVCDLGPGDIVFMDAHCLHRGMCNTEDDRLSLHYSSQAQWVPLKEWGEPDHFVWITSDAFIDQLNDATKPYYLRLRTAERTDEAMSFLKEAAMKAGWQPAGA